MAARLPRLTTRSLSWQAARKRDLIPSLEVSIVNLHKVGRNDPCPCGSGKKFKKCCLNSQRLDGPSSGLHQVDAQDLVPAALEESGGCIPEYDPFVEPDPDQWLALDEEERIDLVMAYHRRAGTRFPRQKVHALFHVIVESQIADAVLPVRGTVERLMAEGLDRHEAIHAVGSVLAGHMNDLMRKLKSGEYLDANSGEDPNVDYFAQLETLTAEDWLRSG